ncbi:MAG TPA: DUF4136 domain-containing protein [Ramlibacter sp.]|nr:DUF4136 domain-containing protein [Ramlibacter sp.]
MPLSLVLGLALLAGCASTPPQATVQVFTPPPAVAAGTTYRHERLPSQAARAGQAELEAAADTVLARAGLRRDDAAGRLAVQVSAAEDRVARGWGGPSIGVGLSGGSGGSGIGIGLGFPIGGMGVQASQRVDVQIRDLSSGQVVFQSQASGSGIAPAALLQAALRDFPNAAPGARQVPVAAAR